MTESTTGVKRQPSVAGILSFFVPGLGQIYNGQLQKGVLLYGFFLSAEFACFMSVLHVAFDPPFNVFLPVLFLLVIYSIVIVDAVRNAKKQGDAYQLKAYNKWYVYLGILLLVLVHPYKTYAILNNVGSGGNAPTLLKGDLILADNFQYTGTVIPQRGDHIIFKYPEDETKDFLKRVIGLPGDVLEIKNREVWINEQQLREP